MRILLIHNYYRLRGGEDVYFDSLTKLLQKNGHEVILYTKKSEDITNFIKKVKTAVNVFENNNLRKELGHIIKQHRPQVAHFHNIYPLITPQAYEICKKNRVPIVQRVPTFRYTCPKGTLFRNGKICTHCKKKNFFYPSIFFGCYRNSLLESSIYSLYHWFNIHKKSFDLVDKYIFQSEYIRDFIIKKTDIIKKHKTEIIPHFVPENKKIKTKKRGNFFIFAGRLVEEKGIIPLLKVFVNLPKQKIFVVGDGPLRDKVLKYSKYKNIKIKLFLTRNKVITLMSQAAFVIIPSIYYETGPFVLMEAYSTSTPVIVPQFGSFKFSVRKNKTGFFYNQNIQNELKNMIIRASLLDDKTYYTMSDLSFKEYRNKYTRASHYKNIINLYNKVIIDK